MEEKHTVQTLMVRKLILLLRKKKSKHKSEILSVTVEEITIHIFMSENNLFQILDIWVEVVKKAFLKNEGCS